jgi:hypothetical protein
MDRRDDFWGHSGVIHDADEVEYGSPSADFDPNAIRHHHPLAHHHNPIHLPIQPLHHHLDHHSSASTNIVISPADVLCGRGKTSFNHGSLPYFFISPSVVVISMKL